MNLTPRRTLLSIVFMIFAGPSFADKMDPVQTCMNETSELEGKLGCIPGLQFKAVERDPAVSSTLRQYDLQFEQPVDHNNPALGTFSQRVVLLHRSYAEPMVLQTSGYSIFGVRESALMRRFATNQIQVEHRFFSTSTPDPKDWSKLNVKQSADDFHHIVVELKKIYKRPWVGTGASKGGMTSVFHHYFYPEDLTGTVADVAPLSFSTEDTRYIDFLKTVGGETYADCRNKISLLQKFILEHREDVLPMISGKFTQIGSSDVALEHFILESPFIFWQYKSPDDESVGCDKISKSWKEAKSAFNFLQEVNPIASYTDSEIEGFQSYYLQAATELGNPGSEREDLKELLKYEFNIDQYTPKGVEYTYSNELMLKIKDWTAHQAQDIVFVYGEFDPWSAGAFPQGKIENNMHQFIVKGGNHGSKFTLLDRDQKSEAEGIFAAWFGKKAVSEPALDKKPTNIKPDPKKILGNEDLETLEFRVRRSLRL